MASAIFANAITVVIHIYILTRTHTHIRSSPMIRSRAALGQWPRLSPAASARSIVPQSRRAAASAVLFSPSLSRASCHCPCFGTLSPCIILAHSRYNIYIYFARSVLRLRTLEIFCNGGCVRRACLFVYNV